MECILEDGQEGVLMGPLTQQQCSTKRRRMPVKRSCDLYWAKGGWRTREMLKRKCRGHDDTLTEWKDVVAQRRQEMETEMWRGTALLARSEGQQLSPVSLVCIRGFVRQNKLHGQIGRIQDCDADRNRYAVELAEYSQIIGTPFSASQVTGNSELYVRHQADS